MKSPRSNFSLGQRLSYPYCETRRMQSEEKQPNRLNGISRNLGAQLSNGRVSHRNSWESYADPLFRTDKQIGALTIPGSRKPCVTTGIFAAMNRSSWPMERRRTATGRGLREGVGHRRSIGQMVEQNDGRGRILGRKIGTKLPLSDFLCDVEFPSALRSKEWVICETPPGYWWIIFALARRKAGL